MTDSLTLTEFIPGTKAKAQDVNANFSAIKDAINEKAAKNGDSAVTFSVADATADTHAINKGQLTTESNSLSTKMSKITTRFCVKSGNTTSGAGDLFSYSVLRITPKIGGTYANLVISDYAGTQTTISSVSELSLTGKADGTYNLFIKPDGTLYTLANTIYKQAKRPTMVDGDVWLNTSVDPFTCIKYDGTNDATFTDVPVGKVTIASSAITSLVTFPFNQNAHNVNAQTTLSTGTNLAASIPNLAMPDYANGVAKSWGTVYQADKAGFLYVQADYGLSCQVSSDNSTWTTFTLNRFDGQGFGTGSFVPVPKGIYYRADYSSSRNSFIAFYPCIGA